ncbi:MAG: rRNA maturation RNase YbeY [Clostridia bacterium]|nr:rRNA maturation RNase YbeY [Clostridia bacterium]
MELTVDFTSRIRKITVTSELKELITEALSQTLKSEKVKGKNAVSVTFCGDRLIKEYNGEFRGIDKVTDVLSFPLADEGDLSSAFDGEQNQLGDIVINLERAALQADNFGHSFEREVAFLAVHSMLHLLGYDHERSEDEDRLMRKKQRAVMKKIGLEV